MSTGNIEITGRKAKESRLRAVVIRADGTREDLGTISYYHRNPLRRWGFKLWRRVNRAFGRIV